MDKFSRPVSIIGTASLHYFGVGLLTVLAYYLYSSLFPSQLNAGARYLIKGLLLGYAFIAPFVYARLASSNRISGENCSKTMTAARYFAGLPSALLRYASGAKGKAFPDSGTKLAVLSFSVKFFFAPLMIAFFAAHAAGMVRVLPDILSYVTGGAGVADRISVVNTFSVFLTAVLLVIDTAIFAFAYLAESERLGNRIKSVDDTLLGWAAALICYPPFLIYAKSFLITRTVQVPVVGFWWFFSLQALSLVFLAVYVWATVALGFRSGNLVNRGIVSRGPYRHVRHPAYIAKNLSWLFALLPFLVDIRQLVYWACWFGVYWLRVVTEERHLKRDPAYAEYCQRVPRRFIPRLVV